ncbi:MAG: NADP-dependent malic enzyme [Ruminococcaceae bacterium]|nr:NADP-dependent malic enzyme [Oscillospiraceae bacterium]MBR3595721.1 NADP-dependent malic enzyme [Clostridia bacterium]
MDIKAKSLELHRKLKGKLEIVSRVPVKTKEDLSLAYTPGVAEACLEIKQDPTASYELTRRWNTVAVITDGTAVLGLGDIGPEAGMPVMEGKCILFKEFADIDALPVCIDSKNPDEIVNTVRLISKSFGGINLEDISAPRCFEIEERLKKECDIPVFHDDQHGTAIIVTAGIINSLRLIGKNKENCKAVICGAGAAGTAIARMLVSFGIGDVTVCDKNGILNRKDCELNNAQRSLAAITNNSLKTGSLTDALVGADVFIGVSAPGIVSEEMISSMAENAIVFAMANPVPEIMPDEAKRAGAAVVGTGRSDFPNQVNNVLAFPGIFKGALSVRASDINEEMKLAAAEAISSLVSDEELSSDYILPAAFDERVGKTVAAAVAKAARKSGVARI